ncbi:hypothetical protein DEO72_LG2g3730 [Vigna unguiculata]|uniref:Uncharacterized protein n=1 Tax=Vigna unguiculata TaxID=3917 RepID=A0A4D6L4H3_VIGUN|nr:hypothetical protein DEO72_LG2g3730 [Vigna unguiculata]
MTKVCCHRRAENNGVTAATAADVVSCEASVTLPLLPSSHSEATSEDLGMSEAAKEAAKFVVAPSREATGNSTTLYPPCCFKHIKVTIILSAVEGLVINFWVHKACYGHSASLSSGEVYGQ